MHLTGWKERHVHCFTVSVAGTKQAASGFQRSARVRGGGRCAAGSQGAHAGTWTSCRCQHARVDKLPLRSSSRPCRPIPPQSALISSWEGIHKQQDGMDRGVMKLYEGGCEGHRVTGRTAGNSREAGGLSRYCYWFRIDAPSHYRSSCFVLPVLGVPPGRLGFLPGWHSARPGAARWEQGSDQLSSQRAVN